MLPSSSQSIVIVENHFFKTELNRLDSYFIELVKLCNSEHVDLASLVPKQIIFNAQLLYIIKLRKKSPEPYVIREIFEGLKKGKTLGLQQKAYRMLHQISLCAQHIVSDKFADMELTKKKAVQAKVLAVNRITDALINCFTQHQSNEINNQELNAKILTELVAQLELNVYNIDQTIACFVSYEQLLNDINNQIVGFGQKKYEYAYRFNPFQAGWGVIPIDTNKKLSLPSGAIEILSLTKLILRTIKTVKQAFNQFQLVVQKYKKNHQESTTVAQVEQSLNNSGCSLNQLTPREFQKLLDSAQTLLEPASKSFVMIDSSLLQEFKGAHMQCTRTLKILQARVEGFFAKVQAIYLNPGYTRSSETQKFYYSLYCKTFPMQEKRKAQVLS